MEKLLFELCSVRCSSAVRSCVPSYGNAACRTMANRDTWNCETPATALDSSKSTRQRKLKQKAL
eukprot:1139756-Amphidinium_carterae.1